MKDEVAARRLRSDAALERLKAFQENLRTTKPWWKKLLAIEHNPALTELRQSYFACENELRSGEKELDRISIDIPTVREIRKKLASAVSTHNSGRSRLRKAEEAFQASKRQSDAQVNSEYNRASLAIRKADYGRGNKIDNYVRRFFQAMIVDVFGGKCLRCGTTFELTLDHFAIPKNKGGNFVLCVAESDVVRMNVVVLCRSCNAEKGETDHTHYFSHGELAFIMNANPIILKAVFDDRKFVRMLREWYRSYGVKESQGRLSFPTMMQKGDESGTDGFP